jgi:hypothetical protein
MSLLWIAPWMIFGVNVCVDYTRGLTSGARLQLQPTHRAALEFELTT